MPALVFDCDGVLADTERHGHLPAFNRTFADFGLPVRWSDDDYRAKVLIGGGKERLRSLLTERFVVEAGLPADPAAQLRAVAEWHARKTEIYTAIIAEGSIPARPGVARVAEEAAAAGWLLAVASTSVERSVRSVLAHVMGDELAARFAVFAGDAAPAKKPAPDIYRLAIESLGVADEDVVVVEDSRNGLLAALAAGLRCVVTVSAYTVDEDFAGAALVLSSLGDRESPDRPAVAAQVLADPYGVAPGHHVTLTDLRAVLARAPQPTPTGGART